MDFGKVPFEQLPKIDFSLPADTDLTRQVLQNAVNTKQPAVYVGCAKWGRKEWIGMIYPEKTKEARFLDEYVKQFNSIELNAVFYNMPKKEQISAWREKAAALGGDFKFCPKFTRGITHIRRLKNAADDTSRYLESISEFKEFLGPCFLQLSDNFGPKNLDVLEEYLASLPIDLDVFVEVRHKDWFEDRQARKVLFEMLHRLKKGAVITDTSGRRDCLHMELTLPHAFIRFVGNNSETIDRRRVEEWAERLADWSSRGLQSVYFFLHQHDESDTPLIADFTVREFNKKLGTSLSAPRFIAKQDTLF